MIALASRVFQSNTNRQRGLDSIPVRYGALIEAIAVSCTRPGELLYQGIFPL